MAEAATEAPQPIEGGETEVAQDMEVEVGSDGNPVGSVAVEQPNGGEKRGREEEVGMATKGDNGAPKKLKVEASVEEERLEKLDEKKEGEEKPKDGEEEETGGGEDEGTGNASLGPKVFGSSSEMFNYFYKFLHFWTPNQNINEYEYMVLLDLLKKGHAEPDKKIGDGIQTFQVRFHPTFKSRCFFLVRADGTSDDFSFRKCIDNILPLPENLKVSPALDGTKKGGGGRGWGGGRGGGRGRGRRGRK